MYSFKSSAYFGVSVAKTQLDGSTKSSIALNSLQIVGLVGVSVGGGFVFSILYFLLMKKFAGPLIKVQCVLFILAMLGYAAYCFLAGVWIAGIILAIITLIMAYVLWCWRSRFVFDDLEFHSPRLCSRQLLESSRFTHQLSLWE